MSSIAPAALGLTTKAASNILDTVLLFSFAVSGCSALMYQVCWQRALYAVIGVDMDSITIIVSTFMLGIGLGGAFGGWLSDRCPSYRLQLYASTELSIAAYGAVSVWVLQALVGSLAKVPGENALALSTLASFAFLIVPTSLMGMTLPLLTLAFNERRANVGVSVGTLYFANTMGAAAGAALVPFVLLPLWNLSQVVWMAAAGNLVVASCAVLAYQRLTVTNGPAR